MAGSDRYSYYLITITQSSKKPEPQLRLFSLGNSESAKSKLSEWHNEGKLMSDVPDLPCQPSGHSPVTFVSALKFASLFLPDPCSGILLTVIANYAESVLQGLGYTQPQSLSSKMINDIARFLPEPWQKAVRAADLLTQSPMTEQQPKTVETEMAEPSGIPCSLSMQQPEASRWESGRADSLRQLCEASTPLELEQRQGSNPVRVGWDPDK